MHALWLVPYLQGKLHRLREHGMHAGPFYEITLAQFLQPQRFQQDDCRTT